MNRLGSLTNTQTLLFVLGYQGGTIHQLAYKLGVGIDDILDADNDRMGELCRIAQQKRVDEYAWTRHELSVVWRNLTAQSQTIIQQKREITELKKQRSYLLGPALSRHKSAQLEISNATATIKRYNRALYAIAIDTHTCLHKSEFDSSQCVAKTVESYLRRMRNS
jgi:hypothetical protein